MNHTSRVIRKLPELEVVFVIRKTIAEDRGCDFHHPCAAIPVIYHRRQSKELGITQLLESEKAHSLCVLIIPHRFTRE